MNHSFGLLMLLGYAIVHLGIQKRANPTGATAGGAARHLEAATSVREG